MAAAKPPGIPPKAPTAPVAPRAPAAPRVPVAPPTPKVSVQEAAADEDWENTEVTKPHDMMLSKEDVRTIVETSTALQAIRAGQDDLRARLSRMEERIAVLERTQLTPIAPAVAVRSPSPPPVPVAAPVPLPVARVAPAAPIVASPPPAPVAPAPTAPTGIVRDSDPFASVQAAPPPPRAERISVDLSPEEMPFDGRRRNRRITIIVLLFLLITVGTFIGIAMTSQMRAGH